MDWKALLGANIRVLRNARGLSQQALAGEAELSLRYLAGVERAEENPSLETIVAIAEALTVDVGELFRRPTESAKPTPFSQRGSSAR